MNIFWCQRILFRNLISKIGAKMNFRRITKKYAADPELGFPTKSILNPVGLESPSDSVEVNNEKQVNFDPGKF